MTKLEKEKLETKNTDASKIPLKYRVIGLMTFVKENIKTNELIQANYPNNAYLQASIDELKKMRTQLSVLFPELKEIEVQNG